LRSEVEEDGVAEATVAEGAPVVVVVADEVEVVAVTVAAGEEADPLTGTVTEVGIS